MVQQEKAESEEDKTRIARSQTKKTKVSHTVGCNRITDVGLSL